MCKFSVYYVLYYNSTYHTFAFTFVSRAFENDSRLIQICALFQLNMTYIETNFCIELYWPLPRWKGGGVLLYICYARMHIKLFPLECFRYLSNLTYSLIRIVTTIFGHWSKSAMRKKSILAKSLNFFYSFLSESMQNKSAILVFGRKETVEPKTGISVFYNRKAKIDNKSLIWRRGE